MHSIARMAQLLRENPGKRGMITANGGYITKHAFGIYSTEAPERPFQHADLQDQVDATLKRDVVIGHQGTGTVEGYSVMYGPEGVTKAFVAAQLDDGRRAWGISEDRDLLQNMTREEFWVAKSTWRITKPRSNLCRTPKTQTRRKSLSRRLGQAFGHHALRQPFDYRAVFNRLHLGVHER